MDFTDGTTWFVAGLCATILIVALIGLVLVIGMRVERRHG